MKYRVEGYQTTVLHIEADKEKAKDIATEDYIWDEAQTAPDTYGVHFNIEEAQDGYLINYIWILPLSFMATWPLKKRNK